MKSFFLLLIFMIIIANGFSQVKDNIGEIVKDYQKSSISFEVIEPSLDLKCYKTNPFRIWIPSFEEYKNICNNKCTC